MRDLSASVNKDGFCCCPFKVDPYDDYHLHYMCLLGQGTEVVLQCDCGDYNTEVSPSEDCPVSKGPVVFTVTGMPVANGPNQDAHVQERFKWALGIT